MATENTVPGIFYQVHKYCFSADHRLRIRASVSVCPTKVHHNLDIRVWLVLTTTRYSLLVHWSATRTVYCTTVCNTVRVYTGYVLCATCAIWNLDACCYS